MNPKPIRKPLEVSPKCPLCHTAVYVGPKPLLGDAVLCLECGAPLEVIKTRPVAVDLTIGEGIDDNYYYSSKRYLRGRRKA